MKATEHIEAAKKPEVRGQKPEVREERPPAGVSAIQKQMDILEEQSLTKRQEDAVAEIRKILGIAPDSPQIDHELPPEPEVQRSEVKGQKPEISGQKPEVSRHLSSK
jgi:hypothetical protein